MDITEFMDTMELSPVERGEFTEWVKRYEGWYRPIFALEEFAEQWDAYRSTKIQREEVSDV